MDEVYVVIILTESGEAIEETFLSLDEAQDYAEEADIYIDDVEDIYVFKKEIPW